MSTFLFILAMLFWAGVWFIFGRMSVRYEIWRHNQKAQKHLHQTERYRDGIDQ